MEKILMRKIWWEIIVFFDFKFIKLKDLVLFLSFMVVLIFKWLY